MTTKPTALRFLSLFDGCHMFGLACRRAGMDCAAVSEVDPHAQAVTRYHYGDTPALGDVRNVSADDVGPVDLILGGWPCQGNSVAGRRGGMADPRSGLFGEVVRLARDLAPRWLLLENVPGALSVRGGLDWASVVGALVELGYGVAWRVFDAQHAGVPQRRRRVFVVGYLGDVARAASVLFEPEGVPGDSPKGRDARARVAASASSGSRGGKPRLARCLTTSATRLDGDTETFIPHVAHTLRGVGHDASEDGTGRGTPVVVDEVQITSPHNRSSARPGAAPTISATSRHTVFNWRGDDGAPSRNVAPTVDADSSGSLACGVRRLMPVECERLQGLPDDWTRYGRREDCGLYELADGPRYRMIGNGGAVPLVEWIAGRITLEAAKRGRLLLSGQPVWVDRHRDTMSADEAQGDDR